MEGTARWLGSSGSAHCGAAVLACSPQGSQLLALLQQLLAGLSAVGSYNCAVYVCKVQSDFAIVRNFLCWACTDAPLGGPFVTDL